MTCREKCHRILDPTQYAYLPTLPNQFWPLGPECLGSYPKPSSGFVLCFLFFGFFFPRALNFSGYSHKNKNRISPFLHYQKVEIPCLSLILRDDGINIWLVNTDVRRWEESWEEGFVSQFTQASPKFILKMQAQWPILLISSLRRLRQTDLWGRRPACLTYWTSSRLKRDTVTNNKVVHSPFFFLPTSQPSPWKSSHAVLATIRSVRDPGVASPGLMGRISSLSLQMTTHVPF